MSDTKNYVDICFKLYNCDPTLVIPEDEVWTITIWDEKKRAWVTEADEQLLDQWPKGFTYWFRGEQDPANLLFTTIQEMI